MGLIGNIHKTHNTITTQDEEKIKQEVVLTDQEVDFILHKLRESTYKGYEFEIYSIIYSKLASQVINNG